MNRLIRLSPTGIEYGDYAWNFASGCGNNIEGKCKSGGFKCWAYSISQRFEAHYPDGFKPTIYPDALTSPFYLKKPSRILCAFMGDLFWDCPEFDPEQNIQSLFPCLDEPETLKHMLFDVIENCPQHTFIFLTKQPQNLIKFSPFPDNCWVGVSATGFQMSAQALYVGLERIEAKVKFISYEPLLEDVNIMPEDFKNVGIKWVIIGAQTKPYKPPKIEWVKEIVEACDKAGIPVFLKDNLLELVNYQSPETAFAFNKEGFYRQEMPK